MRPARNCRRGPPPSFETRARKGKSCRTCAACALLRMRADQTSPSDASLIFTCQTANATQPGVLHFRAPGPRPFPFFRLPRERGTWSAGRRRVPRRAPCGLGESAARRSLRRAHPNDVGVRRLPALHSRRLRRGHVLPRRPAPPSALPAASQTKTSGSKPGFVHDMFLQPRCQEHCEKKPNPARQSESSQAATLSFDAAHALE